MTTPSNTLSAAAAETAAGSLGVDLVCDDEDRWSGFGDVAALVDAAAEAVAAWPGLLRGPASVVIALSCDDDVAALNAQFRGISKPTNVLSFPSGPGAEPGSLGDIILAAETIRREAAEQETPVAHHLQHLVVHGLLHVLGYDHESPAEAERMEALEIEILAKLGIANPYTGELVKFSQE